MPGFDIRKALKALSFLALIVSRIQAQVMLRGSLNRNETALLQDATRKAIEAVDPLAENTTALGNQDEDHPVSSRTVFFSNPARKGDRDSNLPLQEYSDAEINEKLAAKRKLAIESRQLESRRLEGATPTFEYPPEKAEGSFYNYPVGGGGRESVPIVGAVKFGKPIAAGTSFGLVVKDTQSLVIEYSDGKGNWLRFNYKNPWPRLRNVVGFEGEELNAGVTMTCSFKPGIFLVGTHGPFLANDPKGNKGEGDLLLKLEHYKPQRGRGAFQLEVAHPNPRGANYWDRKSHGYDGGDTYNFNKDYFNSPEQIQWQPQGTGFDLGYIDRNGRLKNTAEAKKFEKIIKGLTQVRFGVSVDDRKAEISFTRCTKDKKLGYGAIKETGVSKTAAPTKKNKKHG